MEEHPDSELSAALSRWRESLQARGSLRPEAVDELESHARDSAEALRRKGLSEEEATFLAIRRLGPVRQLHEEFGKLEPRAVWLPRLFWMAFGVTAYLVTVDLTTVAAFATALAGARLSFDGFTLGWLALGARVLVIMMAIGAVGLLLKFRNEPAEAWVSQGERHPLAAVALATVAVLGMRALAVCGAPVLAYSLNPRTLGQFFLVNVWGAVVGFVVVPAAIMVLVKQLITPPRAQG